MKNKTFICDVIDSMGVSKFTWKVFILCGLAILFDGYDTMVVAYTMPQISSEWALTKIQAGSLVSWGLFGLMLGGFVAGILADAIGRKKTLVIACIVYSLFCGLIYFAKSFEMFALFRILSGFGLGAAAPIGLTLVSESAPSKNRGVFVTGMLAFFTGGWILAGALAMYLIPITGWRPLYLIGLLPVFYAILLAKYLPESMRWLLTKGREAEVIKIVQDIERAVKGLVSDWPAGSFANPPEPKVVGLRALFSGSYLYVTINLWILYFFGTMILYGVATWLPSLLVEKGFGIVKSYSFSMLQNFAAVIGSVATGFVADNIGRKRNGVISFILLGMSIVLLGFASNQWLVVFIVITGFLMQFAVTGIQPLIAEAYPTEFRSTGIAWTQGLGRFGGMLGPILMGFVQQMGLNFTGTLCAVAVPAVICAIVFGLFRLETKGMSLENITSAINARG